MKITTNQLRKLIKEEVATVITEEVGTLANLENIYGE